MENISILTCEESEVPSIHFSTDVHHLCIRNLQDEEVKTLLIVEDNARMREMIKSMFKDSFCLVYECEDGSEALDAYKRFRPNWVLMDIVMKIVDGIAATKEIITSFPEAKIVIVTDFDNNGLREEARAAGALHYVLKEDLSVLEEILINNC